MKDGHVIPVDAARLDTFVKLMGNGIEGAVRENRRDELRVWKKRFRGTAAKVLHNMFEGVRERPSLPASALWSGGT